MRTDSTLVSRALSDGGSRRVGLPGPALPAQATFHLMQIEQVIGGVNGDTTAQAIQLRMRFAGTRPMTGRRNHLAVRRRRK